MKKEIIRVKNLIKKYNKATQNAVDNISFSVYEGELFALLGPNGAGKTTTISVLTTTLSKTKGSVTIAGFDIEKNNSDVRKSIGIIFQKPSIDLNLTAEENIRFHSILYGLYPWRPTYSLMPQEYKKKVEDLSSVLDIKKELFHKAKTFSGGMKRKLEIIRSLMHEPKVLFLDEPTSGLDPLSRRNLWEYLKKVRKEKGMTMFLTTHYLEEAEEADKVCIINHGKVVSFGTPAKIKSELVRSFLALDTPKRSLLTKQLDKLKLKYKVDGNIKVFVDGENVQKLIQSIKVPLTHLDIHNPTLEEAYLEIVENKEKEGETKNA